MRKVILLAMSMLLTTCLQAKVYYVSSTGNDGYGGTRIDSAFQTIPKAVSVMIAGDTTYVRGGVYFLNTTVSISKKGTATGWYYLLAYPGERPIFDFSSMAVSSSNRGFNFSGNYWVVQGFDIKGAGDNGMNLSGSNNVIERCNFYENADTGLQLSNGASNNEIINCDSYYNVDPSQGNADGFAPKLDVGTGNYFYGCRAWQNSDDGWDGYMRGSDDVTTILENCWVFASGYLKTGAASSGNGNGFKMGGGDSSNVSNWKHNMILKNCVAFDNRAKGFDQNNNAGSMILYNCTSYRNGTNYSVTRPLASGKVLDVKNCVALGTYGSLGAFAVQEKNSWQNPFVVTNDDFVSIDTAGVRGPRKPDGSLPDARFMHLAEGSDLVDGGVDVGLPYKGIAPDLGAFESDYPVGIAEVESPISEYRLEQNFPNPFNPLTRIRFMAGTRGQTSLHVFNALGQDIQTLFNEEVEAHRIYEITFDASRLPAGVYFYRLTSGDFADFRRMLLIK